MIEFKAECGHTVRAKDEDAGGVVRCSYCGRNANVPETRSDELDFLFSEAEPIDAKSTKRRRGWKPFRRRATTAPRTFDPFSLIFRMCYAALLISIVIFVGNKYVLPFFRGEDLVRHVPKRPERPTNRDSRGSRHSGSSRRAGLIGAKPVGVYVGSTPPGASVFFLSAEKAPPQGRIYLLDGVVATHANGGWTKLPDGDYVVEVVLPWNDPALNDSSLPYYEDYIRFRRSIENASERKRGELLEAFFLPDDATSVFIDQTKEQIFIVRQYRNVKVRRQESEGVRALFLPKKYATGQRRFLIAQLVQHYIPKKPSYRFDEKNVLSELNYWRVPELDRAFIVDALARIGVIPYLTANGQTRLFKIGIHDGSFLTPIIREAPS